jgi:hypothetical protein
MVRGSELDVAVRAAIVSMRFGAGMEAKLIAEKLNVEAGTVRTTCHRIKSTAGSEDLLELLKNCRTKHRSGRPSVKKRAAAAALAAASSAAGNDGQGDRQHQIEEPEARAGNASTSPDRLAEPFETTAWPEQAAAILTAANKTTTTTTTSTYPQSNPQLIQYNFPPPIDTSTTNPALDPQLAIHLPPSPYDQQQWPPRKT